MTTTDILYDLASGLVGAIMGGLVSLGLNWKRNRTLMAEISAQQREIKSMRDENARLLSIIGEREAKILAQEWQILAAAAKSKSRTRK